MGSSNDKCKPFISKELTMFLKGFSIFTVIFGHMISCTGIFSNESLVNNIYIRALICPTDAGMGLFLFISGYGLFQSYQRQGLVNYWESKVKRVWLPYFGVQMVWWLQALLTTGLIWPKEERVLSLLGVLPHNVFDDSMWYISYQLFWYFVFFVAFLMFKEYGIIIVGVIAFACAMGLGNLWMAYNDRFCFFAGVMLAFLEKRMIKREWHINWKNCLLVVVMTIGFRMIYLETGSILLRNTILPIIVIGYILVGEFVANSSWIRRGCVYIGKISYLLYLLEMRLIVDTSKYIVYHYNVQQYWALIYIGLTTITVLLSILINWIISGAKRIGRKPYVI